MRSPVWIIGLGVMAAFLVASGTAQKSTPRNTREGKPPPRRVLSAREAGAAAAQKARLRQQLRGMQRQMQKVQTQIRQARDREIAIADTIETVNTRIARTQERLNAVRRRLRELGEAHDRVTRRLEETQERLAQRRALLARRLRENYERGQTTYLQVLLQSRDLHELLSRSVYVQHIVRSDAELIEGVKRDLAQIAADRRRLEEQRREQQALAAEFEARKQDYLRDRAQQRQLLSQVQAQRHEAEEMLDELEEEARAMTARIRMLSEMLRRRQEALRRAVLARRKALELARKRRGLPPPGPGEIPEYTPLPVWRGGFMRPVAGRITSGFGERFHPILRHRRMHTGVDFGAPHGAPVRAAAAGVVLLAAYSGGYGNCVILDHGDGRTTLYAHCSVLLVREGQEVRQGQVIARVGSTGLSTGPHLHFEVRVNGTPVNPF